MAKLAFDLDMEKIEYALVQVAHTAPWWMPKGIYKRYLKFRIKNTLEVYKELEREVHEANYY